MNIRIAIIILLVFCSIGAELREKNIVTHEEIDNLTLKMDYEKLNFPSKYIMDYTKKTKCIVRHFLVYKDPQWVGKIELKNGKKLFFSSPKSLIEFYHRPGKWFDAGV